MDDDDDFLDVPLSFVKTPDRPKKRRAETEVQTNRNGKVQRKKPATLSSITAVRDKKQKKSTEVDLWTLKHEPREISQCVVQPDKINELRDWMQKHLRREPARRVLLVHGPSGTGKTVMIKLLAKELNFSLSEWTEPVNVEWKNARGDYLGSDGSAQMYSVSRQKQFREFLYQSRAYVDLCSPDRTRLVVVRECPEGMTTEVRRRFWEIIEEYSRKAANPMILIMTTENEKKEIRMPDHVTPYLQTLAINQVIKTKMKKCLTDILSTESMSVPDDVFEDIIQSAEGDVRSAINNLQMYIIGKPLRTVGAKKPKQKKSKKEEPEKTHNLNIFHAVGKVLHNKRIEDGGGNNIPRTNVEKLMENLPIDPQLYLYWVHQSYLSFCDDVTVLSNIAEDFSAAEAFTSTSGYHGFEPDRSGNTPSSIWTSAACRSFMLHNVDTQVKGRMMTFHRPELLTCRASAVQNRRKMMDYVENWRPSDYASAGGEMVDSLPYRSRVERRNNVLKNLVQMSRNRRREEGKILEQLPGQLPFSWEKVNSVLDEDDIEE
ncbi:hypothetical protein PROFUN_14818 [Planoprotostelium fungivorum]|uniref:AAA+ ATPase domain-containing protein n=1 Tax=Planoprotostelium fungivorum TaxID=1890364 RepID=A0A2P6MYE2_9EUKA|nr:hypothetical protein PROFUN_14818 [Planoprotostelium fungivorum]